MREWPSQRVNFKHAFQEFGVDYVGFILVNSGSNNIRESISSISNCRYSLDFDQPKATL